ncbi:hypothetical protein C8T65DRAFT_528275, partial [Cerioporus squamosus]
RAVLDYMRELKLDLPLLLWAVSYNEAELVTDALVKYERTALLSSEELPGLLNTWYRPPRVHGRGTRSKGTSASLEAFSLELVSDIVNREITAVGEFFRTIPDTLSEEAL